jgi:hypothetical protein
MDNAAQQSRRVLLNPIESAVSGADKALWLNVFHRQIGSFRASLRSGSDAQQPSSVTEGLAAVLNEARQVYSELLQALLQKLGIDPDLLALDLDAVDVARRFLALTKCPVAVEKASVGSLRAACARCLVYLGDVARYRQMHSPRAANAVEDSKRPLPRSPPPVGVWHPEWREAEECYQRAHLMSTEQAGAAHNQLAVLAQTSGDISTAVMHYLCALSAVRAFDVARDNMIAMVGRIRDVVAARGANGAAQSASEIAEEVCSSLVLLYAGRTGRSRVGSNEASLGRSLLRASSEVVQRVDSEALPSHMMQPLVLSAVCTAHLLALLPNARPPPLDAPRQDTPGSPESPPSQFAVDTLLELASAACASVLRIWRRRAANREETTRGGRGVGGDGERGGGDVALLEMLEAESAAESAADAGDGSRGSGRAGILLGSRSSSSSAIPADDTSEQYRREADFLRALLPALLWVRTSPAALCHASPERLTAFGAALCALQDAAAAEGIWRGDAAGPRKTSLLHSSLLGLSPLAAALQEHFEHFEAGAFGVEAGAPADAQADAPADALAGAQAGAQRQPSQLGRLLALRDTLSTSIIGCVRALMNDPARLPQSMRESLRRHGHEREGERWGRGREEPGGTGAVAGPALGSAQPMQPSSARLRVPVNADVSRAANEAKRARTWERPFGGGAPPGPSVRARAGGGGGETAALGTWSKSTNSRHKQEGPGRPFAWL